MRRSMRDDRSRTAKAHLIFWPQRKETRYLRVSLLRFIFRPHRVSKYYGRLRHICSQKALLWVLRNRGIGRKCEPLIPLKGYRFRGPAILSPKQPLRVSIERWRPSFKIFLLKRERHKIVTWESSWLHFQVASSIEWASGTVFCKWYPAARAVVGDNMYLLFPNKETHACFCISVWPGGLLSLD